MNHDSKHNDFEYEKETFPKTPEHFKQLVVNQVAQEQQKKNISPIKSKKKWMPAKVAAVIIVCATMGTTGAYAGIKQYQARSQQYLQETGRITTPESSSEEETSAASDTTDSVAPATIVSEESGLVTTFSDTWPDFMLELYDQDGKYQKLSTPYMNVIDAYYDGGLLSIYGEATEYGLNTLGDWFLPDRIVINDTVYLATWDINGIYGDEGDPQYKRGAFHATVELSDADLPDNCKVQIPLTTVRDPKTGYFYTQTISFYISGNTNVKPAITASAANGATVTVGESKTSASGTYLSLTWNFGKDKASYDQFDKIISGDTIHNWIYCHIIDSNGNIFDTKTDSETFSSVYFDSNDSGDEHWNNSGESTYVDDDGNYCFQTNILLPALTQDFTSLEVTPYVHLKDGTETDLDFAAFRVDYE